MTEKGKEWQHHEHEMKDEESPAYMAHKDESSVVPPKAYKKKEMPVPQPSVSYGHSHGMAVQQFEMKTEKKVYHAEYAHKKHAHKVMCHPCPPIVCEPQYVFHDHSISQEVPIVHPIIHVHRYNVVPVHKHYYQHYTDNPMVSP
ncbi:hypothetical protein [Alicyclobacillus ferrooxydans]|uniref:Uncharacterized protein n=1 Tax=Alicyclobacillus ferrooxydans TaxID=471514 RepID=A0A0P9CZZ3_9BACL|nr:hypothetical protein [Alicyclobacillus ferrooxydans]KPV42745.1 hypothetical protein AN477_15420 [Alicyclobacillus ferrooxydans]